MGAALFFLALALLTTFLLRQEGRADGLDRDALTWRFTTREKLTPSRVDPNVVIVEVDERSLDHFPEPIVGWGGHFADALDRLHASGAAVVAFDWLQDKPMEPFFPGKDTLWADAIGRAGNVVLPQASSADRSGKWILPAPQLLYALPGADKDLGYVELSAFADADTLVTAMHPVMGNGSELVKSLAVRTLERYFDGESRLEPGRWSIPGRASAPLRADGTALVNYAPQTGRPGSFERISLYDVATGPKSGDPRFRGKIVVIGASYTAANDFQYIPVLNGWRQKERRIPGVEIHANLIRTLLGRPLSEPGPLLAWGMAVLLSAGGTGVFFRIPFLRALAAVIGLAAVWVALSFTLFVTRDYALPISLPLIGLAVAGGGLGLYRAVREEGERRTVLNLWGRYQDPRLVDYLLRHPDARGGEGQERQVTVLFADLKNFTKTVERLAPAEALHVLNRYLGLMAAVIIQHGGVVDKFLGDGLMAQWGAPEGGDEHARSAVRACLEIERQVAELTQSIGGKDVTFALRLTLHTGDAVMGWVGATRLEFTIIGDTVNVTSRLQETAKELACDFLISESTYERVRDLVVTGKQAEVEIRGRVQPLQVHEVVGETKQTP